MAEKLGNEVNLDQKQSEDGLTESICEVDPEEVYIYINLHAYLSLKLYSQCPNGTMVFHSCIS